MDAKKIYAYDEKDMKAFDARINTEN